MADLGYRNPGPTLANPTLASGPSAVAGPSRDRAGTPWGAIWAGLFSFAAIWTVFGMLGVAIFDSSGALYSSGSGTVSWGMGVWSIILTCIAMFVAGRVTARLADATTARDAVMAAQTMFGLAAVGVLLLLGAVGAGATAAASPYAVHVIVTAGWFGWLGVLFGWIGALAGARASFGARPLASAASPARDIRNAA